jgi:plasmid stability protein
MGTLYVRGVSESTLVALRIEAATRGVTLKDLVIEKLGIPIAGTSKQESEAEPITARRELTIEERRVIAQAELRRVEKAKGSTPAVPAMEGPLKGDVEGVRGIVAKAQARIDSRQRPDRDLVAFREKYGRGPASDEELDRFRKKGW